MDRGERRVRGLAVLGLAGMVMAVALLSPVGAAVTKPKVKKISTRSANQVFTQRSGELRLTCPAGTTPFAGACMETSSRPNQDWFESSQACASVGRRLPTVSELWGWQALGNDLEGDFDDGEQTSNLALDGAVESRWTVRDDGDISVHPVTDDRPFRCVTSPTN